MNLPPCRLMRMSVNGAAAYYTCGMVIDYANRTFRGQIVECGIPVDDVLRGLRTGDEIHLKVWTELLDLAGPGEPQEGKIQSVEYDGPAIVKMIRYRATRNALASFRIAFTLIALAVIAA